MDKPHVCRSGPPPHVGWWCCPPYKGWRGRTSWRWWDGEAWSTYARENERPAAAGAWARSRTSFAAELIFWNDYWPPGARVPRINPAATSGEKP